MKLDKLTLFITIFAILFIGFLVSLTLFDQQKNLQPLSESNNTIPQDEPTQTVEHLFLIIAISDNHGSPIAGSTVQIADQNQQTLFSAQTNADGRVEFDDISEPLEAFTILAEHPDYFSNQITADQLDTQYTLTLERKYAITGTILSATQPVANAEISYHQIDSDEISTLQNDENGAFKLYPLRQGEYQLEVTHPDYLSTARTVPAGEDVEIQLKQEATLHITCTDEHDATLAGAEVILQQRQQGLKVIEQTTNTSGLTVFDKVKSGTYEITATAPFEAPAVSRVLNITQDHYEISIPIGRPTFNLTAKVQNAISNEAVPNATVVCQSQLNATHVFHAQTDSSGTALVRDIPLGKYILFVEELDGYISGNHPEYETFYANPARSLIQFDDQDVDDVVISLMPSWKVSGTVYDADGKPESNAQVHIKLYQHPQAIGQSSKRLEFDNVAMAVNADGTYELEGKIYLPQDNKEIFEVEAMNDVNRSASSEPFSPQPGKTLTGIDIHYKTKANLKGYVTNSSGKPVKNADIYVWTEESMEMHDETGHFAYHRPITRLSGYAKSNAEGYYEDHVQPGQYSINAQTQGLVSEIKEVTIEEGKVAEVDFTLNEDSKIMNGVVVNENNQPVANAKIYAQQYLNRPYTSSPGTELGTNNPDGSFEFDIGGMFEFDPDPHYYVTAIVEGKPNLEGSLKTRETSNLTIRVESDDTETCTIRGRVVTQAGTPQQEYQLLVMPDFRYAHENISEIDTDWHNIRSMNGRFEIENINCAYTPIRLVARHEMAFSQSEVIELEPDQVIDGIELTLRPPRTLTGLVTHEGAPLEDVEVRMQVATNRFEQLNFFHEVARILYRRNYGPGQTQLLQFLPKTTTNEQGQFVLENVPNVPLWLMFIKINYEFDIQYINESLSPQVQVPPVELPTISRGVRRR